LNHVKSDKIYFASKLNKKVPRGQLANIHFVNDVGVNWRSQMQLRPHSPFSISWGTWSAWSPGRFTHGETVSGSHFTGCWLKFRADL